MKTKIPIPPIQCVKLRQNSVACFKFSTSVKILEPVVVNPDTASKKQSTKEGISPDKQNGNPPKKETTTQAIPTAIIPSFAKYEFILAFLRVKTYPKTRQIPITIK